jgi:hypothetical protein
MIAPYPASGNNAHFMKNKNRKKNNREKAPVNGSGCGTANHLQGNAPNCRIQSIVQPVPF